MANLFTLTRRQLAPVLKLSFQAQLRGQLEVCGSGTEYFQHIPRRIQNYQNHTYAQFHTSSRCSDIFSVQDEEDFKTKVLESKKAVIVDFHAKWCGPCKVLMPRLEKAIAATKEAVDLAKVDIDELPDLAMEYNVQAVPSVIAMKNGKVVDKFVGLKDDDQIGTFITAAGKK